MDGNEMGHYIVFLMKDWNFWVKALEFGDFKVRGGERWRLWLRFEDLRGKDED